MLRSCLALAVVAAVLSSHVRSSTADDWPQWRGPQRDGVSTEKGLFDGADWSSQPPELLWQAEGLGEGFSSVAIVDGRIYTVGNHDDGQAVMALDDKDGKILWSTPLTEKPPRHDYEGSRTTPTVDGDRLYVVTSDGQIACLKIGDGNVVWSKNFKKEWDGRLMSGWGFAESPLVDGSRVICTPGGKEAGIVALDKLTGEEIWRSPVEVEEGKGSGGAGYASLVVSNGGGVKQYITLMGRGAVGVRAEDGKQLWSYRKVSNGTANIPTPVVKDDYVFISTGYGAGAAGLKLEPSGNGGVEVKELYRHDGNKLQNHHGGMVLVGDYVYFGHKHGNGFPVCVNLKSGEIAWGGETRGPGGGSAAVVAVDGHLIFRYQDGKVALIEATPSEYRLKGSFKPAYQKGNSWAHPVVANGKLYLREQDKLMCYKLK